MFGYYLKLRCRQLGRLLVSIGLLRCLFLLLLVAVACAVLVKVDDVWIVPAVVCMGLLLYHNERKDKQFLMQHVGHLTRFLRKEYLLIGFPFLLLEGWKGNGIGAVVILLACMLIPGLKPVRRKSLVVPLPFLYRGGMEYLRLFRRYGWVYFLLLIVAVVGVWHGNVRVAKVSLLVWGVVQTAAFAYVPRLEDLVHFRNYGKLEQYICLSALWNGTVTSVLLMAVILAASPVWKEVIFVLSAWMGGVLALWNIGLFRYVCRSTWGIVLYQMIVVIPLFLYACVVPLLFVPFIVLDVMLSLVVKNKLKQIWK